jgi:membrane peptidoglycan carboxypeptidase
MTGGLAMLVRTGLLVGVAVAALVYPIAALAGLTVKDTADKLAMPAGGLRITPPSQTSRVYAADGTTMITQFYEEYRSYTPISAMSKSIQQAIVAAEDSRFYQHNGVDIKGVARAFVANQQAGEVSQGASTLTMQYVRNALRDSAETPAEVYAATEQTGTRKFREVKLAVELEKRMSKTEILERYLNVAYFGHRAYGIHAAAEVYFSKKAIDLTVAESALLAGVVQAPSAYDPAREDPGAAINRRNYVISRMVELGYVDPAAADEARAAPLGLRLSEPINDCVASQSGWGFFCGLLRSWWMTQPTFGASPGERLDRLRRGGYRIVTSLDPRTQAAAQAHIDKELHARNPYALGMVAVEPGTGRVRAMAINRVYSIDQAGNGPHSDPRQRRKIKGNYPNTVNPLLGGGDLPGYQAGSTFKLFTMLAALERGYPLSTAIHAPQRLVSKYRMDEAGPAKCAGRFWCPENASRSMTGRQTVWSGFGKSVNTYFVQLEQRVGAEAAVRMAERLGLRWRTEIDRRQAAPGRARTWGAFTLGVADTTPLEMANAYATVAADGVRCDPMPVLSIVDLRGVEVTRPGSTMPVASPQCEQALSVETARGALDAARCVTGYGAAMGECGGWSTAPSVYRTVKRPIAGKTGTTDDNRAAWFVGMTPGLTIAGFIADPDNPFHAVGKWGHDKPRESVARTMRDALAGTPVRGFTPPSKITAKGTGKSARKPR